MRRFSRLVPVALFLATGALYILSASSHVTLEDSGEFIYAAFGPGVVHPPGYPAWCLAANMFSRLPFGGAALRINVFSALIAAAAIGMLGALFTRRHGIVAGILGSLFLAVNPLFWSQAIIADVYALSVFFLVLFWWLCELYSDNWPYSGAMGLVFGLGMMTHYMIVPVALLIFLRKPGFRVLKNGRWIVFAGFAVLSAGLAAYMPIRSASGILPDWGHTKQFVPFLRHVSMQSLFVDHNNASVTDFLNYVADFFRIIRENVGPAALFIAVAGVIMAFFNKRRYILWTFVVIFLPVLLVLAYLRLDFSVNNRYTIRVFYLLPMVVMYELVSVGLKNMHRVALKLKAASAPAAFAAGWIVFFGLPDSFGKTDMRNFTYGRDYAWNLLDSVRPGAVVLTRNDEDMFLYWYFAYVEGRNTSCIPLYSPMHSTAWYMSGVCSKVELFPGVSRSRVIRVARRGELTSYVLADAFRRKYMNRTFSPGNEQETFRKFAAGFGDDEFEREIAAGLLENKAGAKPVYTSVIVNRQLKQAAALYPAIYEPVPLGLLWGFGSQGKNARFAGIARTHTTPYYIKPISTRLGSLFDEYFKAESRLAEKEMNSGRIIMAIRRWSELRRCYAVPGIYIQHANMWLMTAKAEYWISVKEFDRAAPLYEYVLEHGMLDFPVRSQITAKYILCLVNSGKTFLARSETVRLGKNLDPNMRLQLMQITDAELSR